MSDLLGDDGSDSPPLSAGSRLPDHHDTDRAPPPSEPPQYATAEQVRELADQIKLLTNMVSEVVTAVASLPVAFARIDERMVQEREHSAHELDTAAKMLAGAIEGTRLSLIDHVNCVAADLDRRADERATKTNGKVDALAQIVSDHHAVVEEVADLATDLARRAYRESPPSLSVVEAEE